MFALNLVFSFQIQLCQIDALWMPTLKEHVLGFSYLFKLLYFLTIFLSISEMTTLTQITELLQGAGGSGLD